MGKSVSQLCCALLCSFCLWGCAFNIIAIQQVPAHFVAAEGQAWKLDATVRPNLAEGKTARLKAGTTWRLVGRVDQGDVFHTDDQNIWVVASHQHEADIVVKNSEIVGFYLRVEKTFTPAHPPIAIKTTPL